MTKLKEDTLKTIKSRGYWRINFRPALYSVRLGTVARCREIVEQNALELRGWEYPAILLGAPDVRRVNGDKYFELSNNWWNHIELWRMYKSGQFIHYLALREDWFERDGFSKVKELRIQPGTKLAVISTIYQITEIFSFLGKLAMAGIYDEGVEVDISLNGTKNRELWIEEMMRVGFSFPRKTGAEILPWNRTYSKEELMSSTTIPAKDLLLAWFDMFGWQAPVEIIEADQEKLLTRRF